MYEYTDKVIRVLNRRFIRYFAKLKTLSGADELHVLQTVKDTYERSESDAEKMYLKIAKETYSSVVDMYFSDKKIQRKTTINKTWVKDTLNRYDPVTGYVYLHEVERKRARTFESIVAAVSVLAAVKTALRYWANMVKQYCDEVTDYTVLQAYQDYGVKRVKWNTERDGRVCPICESRDGKIYPIDNIPPKPHIGCRCWFTPEV